MINLRFKNKILWKVYVAWFFKRILPLIIFQIIVVAIALKILANKVFVGQVLQNATIGTNADFWGFFRYLISAFFNTSPVVQIAAFIGLGIGALILRDAARALRAYFKTFKKIN